MSRVGKQPIPVPQGTKVALSGGVFEAEGPKGKVAQQVVDGVEVSIDEGVVTITRVDDSGPNRAKHGLMRALLANAVAGVTTGWTKELEIHGVGYRAEVQGRKVNFVLGYSHPVEYAIPEGVDIQVDRNTSIKVTGADRQKVGQVAAELRALRKPDAYKGKGVRYKDERLRLKVGKAGVA
ncbi:MAG: 50S ribosomal protein L6 [Acidobacteriota bacterium]|nr:50S ribosomal protein L6 [Acidobacteriota bacterium]